MRTFSKNRLPAMLANLWPRRTVAEDQGMSNLALGQGAHRTPDSTDTLPSLKIPYFHSWLYG